MKFSSLAEVREEMERLSDKFGVNVCGEGDEYETFTLDILIKHFPINISLNCSSDS